MRSARRSAPKTVFFAAVVVCSAALLAPAPAAQGVEHVVEAKGLIARETVRPGETFKAALVLKVQAGYHINDNAPLDEFMIPTELTVAGAPDFEVLEISFPPGRRARFSYSEAELVVYEGEVLLGVLLKAKDGLDAGIRTVKGALTYQACNDESCLPPMELPFEIAVPVATAGECADIHPEIFSKIRFKSLQK